MESRTGGWGELNCHFCGLWKVHWTSLGGVLKLSANNKKLQSTKAIIIIDTVNSKWKILYKFVESLIRGRNERESGKILLQWGET